MAHLLDAARSFPPVTTAEWDAQIAKDLAGIEARQRLTWRTDEGIRVHPFYRSEHISPRGPLPHAGGGWTLVQPGDEPALSVSVIDAHEQGATAVQEVAYALAQGADALAAGSDVLTLGFAIGSNHFMEVAKLRSARLLWQAVAGAFGAKGEVRIHARTAGENKTLYDPYVNLLRVTTEALSAVLGGCDSLTITPCGFDPHLAENVHHILREESHLDKVADPGAGAYYVEALTDAVSGEAWKLFQAIESTGGWRSYRISGALAASLAASREAKEKAVAERRRILVGTNDYPDLGERQLDSSGRLDAGWRLAETFEAIRLRTERHAASTGSLPRVLLLERGDPRMRKVRSTFCLNFFGCAGFDVVQADALVDADLVVLCSADDEYVELARAVVSQVRVPVVVAGYPAEHADALASIGVEGFVHARSNAVNVLREWQDRLGMDE